MTMFEQHLAAVLVVAVCHVDKRLSEVRQRKQQLFFHALPIPIRDFIDAALGIELVGEEPLFMAKLFREESIDEGDVVMHAPCLENLFAAEPQTQVPF